ncbi:MAG: methylated-DNA--[protein]-cysteine S-methyltransferase, partial [Pseudomonadota bacterium]
MTRYKDTANSMQSYQAKVAAPFGMLGIRCTPDGLSSIEFLPADSAAQQPTDSFTRSVCAQLAAYFKDADFAFNLPLTHNGTIHQRKVWQAMSAIPRGQTRSYGDLAAQIGSSARAVGQACGANPIPIIIPCHRILAKTAIGG